MKLVHAALALVVFSTVAVGAPDGIGARSVESALPRVERPEILSIVIRCEDCTDRAPIIGLLWNVADAAQGERRRVLTARDWDAGVFVLAGTSEVELQGEPLQGGGWIVHVRLPDAGLPFRVTGGLPGFVPDKGVYWPAQDPGPVVFDMKRLDDVLEANPAWDPARTAECEILVPKSAELPVVMTSGDQPRAWLFPGVGGGDDASSWTFQFVRPGASLMERVSVRVTAFDEGGSWAFRLPLEGVLPAPVAPRIPGGATPDPLSLAKGHDAEMPPHLVSVAGTGTFDLADCPRIVR